MMIVVTWAFAILASMVLGASGQSNLTSCPNVPAPLHPYSLAPGWSAIKVADGLTSPRDLVIDSLGRLLVVEEGLGISQHVVGAEDDGCIASSRLLVANSTLNHGIALSPDGGTLYASSSAAAFRWSYDATSGDVGGPNATVVAGMGGSDHVTRTLVVAPQAPNLLVVSHGADENLDMDALSPSAAQADVKVFDMDAVPDGGYNWTTDGWIAGYGLRNDVGLAFDGNHMLWSVENSADQLTRTANGATTDIHQNNPAEELNYLGDVTQPNQTWYGYPVCFTVWDGSEFPADPPFQTGEQFVQMPSPAVDDATCAAASEPPRLAFQAHMAPLGAAFDAGFDALFVAMHGSWDRSQGVGYKVVEVPFGRGADDGAYGPAAGQGSTDGYSDVFFATDEAACSLTTCTRPVGLVFDAQGRLYFTSDATGEMFMLSRPPA
ncbi:soluble quino protein glucose dehydrogenase [Xylariaceae sp. FL0804]|nr:soluble quino protein glucose dehydrogenase [Xylariaceae sp. FL0804]